MRASVIVWDLETVPDLGGFAAANDLVGKSDVEVREAIGDKFPKHIYHSIALIAHRECDHWAVDALGFGLHLCRAGFPLSILHRHERGPTEWMPAVTDLELFRL